MGSTCNIYCVQALVLALAIIHTCLSPSLQHLPEHRRRASSSCAAGSDEWAAAGGAVQAQQVPCATACASRHTPAPDLWPVFWDSSSCATLWSTASLHVPTTGRLWRTIMLPDHKLRCRAAIFDLSRYKIWMGLKIGEGPVGGASVACTVNCFVSALQTW